MSFFITKFRCVFLVLVGIFLIFLRKRIIVDTNEGLVSQSSTNTSQTLILSKEWKINDNDLNVLAEQQQQHQHEHQQQQQNQQQQQQLPTSILLQREGQYGSNVKECSLSILVMDPRIPYFPKNDIMYLSALESIGEYAPENACIILQVSSCVLYQHLQRLQNDSHATDDTQYNVPHPDQWETIFSTTTIPATVQRKELFINIDNTVLRKTITEMIYKKSGIFFKNRMNSGYVRITFLNHTKYNFDTCYNFYSPSRAWLNYDYYETEFISGIDNDFILFFERDSALCQPMTTDTVQPWKSFAYIGGPIKSLSKGKNAYEKLKNFTLQLKNKTFRKYWEDSQKALDVQFPTNIERIFPYSLVVGNGGLSLRNRIWIQRAIQICPNDLYSGLIIKPWENKMTNDKEQQIQLFLKNTTNERESVETNCTIMAGEINDDVYFSYVLQLIGAPIPHPFTASLFSADAMLPDHVIETIGSPNTISRQDTIIKKYWVDNKNNDNRNEQKGVELYRQMLKEDGHVIPIGIHKAWRSSHSWTKDGMEYYKTKMKSRCKYIL